MNPKDVHVPHNITNNNVCALFSAGCHFSCLLSSISSVCCHPLNMLVTIELSSLKIRKTSCYKPEKIMKVDYIEKVDYVILLK